MNSQVKFLIITLSIVFLVVITVKVLIPIARERSQCVVMGKDRHGFGFTMLVF